MIFGLKTPPPLSISTEQGGVNGKLARYGCLLGYGAVCWHTGRGRGARRPYGGVEAGTAAAQTNS
ncbi:hypothetical protein ES319_A08G218100v1 [Gossypium barbadense]|uniref:Uncharacterized protein n=1 Tax=Gossypium barbadense TaxID=3634 RepID=A0A5J5UV60_GOSBA|nr:hypothetical protein ES319_A08G218100v1 [Gossypium barbadense]